jgi:hypothetical protein
VRGCYHWTTNRNLIPPVAFWTIALCDSYGQGRSRPRTSVASRLHFATDSLGPATPGRPGAAGATAPAPQQTAAHAPVGAARRHSGGGADTSAYADAPRSSAIPGAPPIPPRPATLSRQRRAAGGFDLASVARGSGGGHDTGRHPIHPPDPTAGRAGGVEARRVRCRPYIQMVYTFVSSQQVRHHCATRPVPAGQGRLLASQGAFRAVSVSIMLGPQHFCGFPALTRVV